MARPLTLALDKPNPKISWNLVRGVLSTSAHKVVRPVRLVNPCAFSPRASQVITTPDTVMTAIDTDGCTRREELPHPRVDGEEAQASDQDARHQANQRGPRVREEKESYGRR